MGRYGFWGASRRRLPITASSALRPEISPCTLTHIVVCPKANLAMSDSSGGSFADGGDDFADNGSGRFADDTHVFWTRNPDRRNQHQNCHMLIYYCDHRITNDALLIHSPERWPSSGSDTPRVLLPQYYQQTHYQQAFTSRTWYHDVVSHTVLAIATSKHVRQFSNSHSSTK